MHCTSHARSNGGCAWRLPRCFPAAISLADSFLCVNSTRSRLCPSAASPCVFVLIASSAYWSFRGREDNAGFAPTWRKARYCLWDSLERRPEVKTLVANMRKPLTVMWRSPASSTVFLCMACLHKELLEAVSLGFSFH
jgi:hypothetical protein